MDSKINCWEFMKCGREEGGKNAQESGVCPVAAAIFADGLNGGSNGGRICWVTAEELPEGSLSCKGLNHISACFSCEFKYKVMNEEGLLNVCQATGLFLQINK